MTSFSKAPECAIQCAGYVRDFCCGEFCERLASLQARTNRMKPAPVRLGRVEDYYSWAARQQNDFTAPSTTERNDMTTSVTILNHGPDSVSVAPIDDSGNPAETERQTVAPNGISRQILVYANRNIHVAESKPVAEPKT